jgi:integrase/recombinase XerD
MGILRERIIEEMKLRNFAAATQKSYLYAVATLAKYYKRPPDQLDSEQIRSYLLYLSDCGRPATRA